MIPSLKMSYQGNGRRADVEHYGCCPATYGKPSNGPDLGQSQFMSSISFSKCGSAFARCVSRIFKRTAKPQMGRINAGRIVTARAIVKDHHAFGNRTEVKNPANAVSFISLPLSQRIKLTITVWVSMSNPKPAGSSGPNLGKESGWGFRRKSLRLQVFGRNLLHRLVICPVGLQARRAFLISFILALPASVFSQGFSYRRPFILQSAAAVTNIVGPVVYWWVAADAATNNGPFVTNWIDRIQHSVWTNFIATNRYPTLEVYPGTNYSVHFDYTQLQFLTNAGVVMGVTNCSTWIIMQRDTAVGAFHDFLDEDFAGTLEWLWDDTQSTLAIFGGFEKAKVGNPGTGKLFDTGFTSDFANNRVIGYTNGVACVTNTLTTIGGTWRVMGGITNDGWWNGYITELMIYTNTILDSTSVSNLHWYGTNTYGYTP